MRRWIALSVIFVCMVTLVSCAQEQKEQDETTTVPKIIHRADHLHILLPYGTVEDTVIAHRDEFVAALHGEMEKQGWRIDEITLDIASTAAATGKALDDGTADVAIMPASTYFTYEDDLSLMMTATKRGISVDTTTAEDWNGGVDAPAYTKGDCAYGRTLIGTTPSEKGRAIAQSAKNGTLTWEELEDAKWMYCRGASSSDFLYPDLWLTPAFGKTLLDIPDSMEIDGYAALFSEAGRGNADVIVMAADQRIDFERAWRMPVTQLDDTGKQGLGHEDSIFNDIRIIGVTPPIYGDVMVVRSEEDPYAAPAFQTALINAVHEMESDEAARALWKECGYSGFVPAMVSHYNNIRNIVIYGQEN